ncbi:hypothetical protein KY306_00035 [Candidatus Woesearchaeota archaeon]|nr:hypothetical protein [Candidatus Woesearchaeota archaeon]
MKALAITDKGLEDISLLEIKELLKVNGEIRDSAVIFDYKKKEDLYLLCYKGQSVFKVLHLIDNFSVKKDLIKEMKAQIKKIDFSEYKGKSFAVRCWHKKIKNSRGEIEKAAGSVIPGKVDLNNPDVRFFVFVYGKDVYFGIDITGRDLSERDYKIFSHPHSLKGPLAYGLVRLSEYSDKKVLLNCFCRSGEIGIEAGLWGSGLAVNYYNKEKMGFEFDLAKFDKTKKKKLRIYCVDSDPRSLAATKKNAKIAGVSKEIQVSRFKIEDLDIKFKEKEADCLICQIGMNQAKELFYQANYILKGKMVLLCQPQDNFDKYAQEQKFKKIQERIVERGGINYKVLVYAK